MTLGVEVVANAMAATPVGQRHQLLHDIIAHAAQALVIIEGRRKASEHVYGLADAMATCPLGHE